MPPKKRIVKDKVSVKSKTESDKGIRQVVNVRVNLEEKKKQRRRRVKRVKKGYSDTAQPGPTGVEYLGPKYLPAPSIPYLPPATYELPKQFQSLPQPPQLAGLLEDVKRERSNLLEDIQREVKSTVIKEVQKAQGAEQRAELEKIGFQTPVPEYGKLADKVYDYTESFDNILSGIKESPIVQEPREEAIVEESDENQVFPFQSVPFIEEIKSRGRIPGRRNRPPEIIQAERKAKEEKRKAKEQMKLLNESISKDDSFTQIIEKINEPSTQTIENESGLVKQLVSNIESVEKKKRIRRPKEVIEEEKRMIQKKREEKALAKATPK